MRTPKQIKPQSSAFAVEWWLIGRVIPYQNNARVIPASAVEKVASPIRAFGWRQPIVVDADGVIIVGHVRLLAAQSMAMTEALRIHDLRHFAASTLTGAGIEDNIIGLLTGHKSRELRRYQHMREELKRKTV